MASHAPDKAGHKKRAGQRPDSHQERADRPQSVVLAVGGCIDGPRDRHGCRGNELPYDMIVTPSAPACDTSEHQNESDHLPGLVAAVQLPICPRALLPAPAYTPPVPPPAP